MHGSFFLLIVFLFSGLTPRILRGMQQPNAGGTKRERGAQCRACLSDGGRGWPEMIQVSFRQQIRFCVCSKVAGKSCAVFGRVH
mmetsp:Transcript_39458/g.77647  ORF Transcript_39458/g.77647 Transcript_39458/m.77647 type:complete len:84 (-) Transcript_39458:482-733(-)